MEGKKQSKIVRRILYWLVIAVVYACGVYGYYSLGGENFVDSAYYAAQLFFMESAEPKNTNMMLYTVRIVSPLLTATAVLFLLKNVWKSIWDFFVAVRYKNTTAIYSEEWDEEIEKNFEHPIFVGDKINRLAKSHVIMFQDELKALSFAEMMEGKIRKDSLVYIKVEKLDAFLLKEKSMRFFNVNEIIARNYWKEHHLQNYLQETGEMKVKIAIIGFRELGQRILDYGLTYNIYSLTQDIEYHVWGDGRLYEDLLHDMDMMNGDQVFFHEWDWKNEISCLNQFDRIIITEEVDMELVQALLHRCYNTEINIYSRYKVNWRNIYASKMLDSFGENVDTITEKNIKTDELYRLGKLLNYRYECMYNGAGREGVDVEVEMEQCWNSLRGFLKGSNLSAADYHTIRLLVMEKMKIQTDNPLEITEAQKALLSEMEHVRWSRYHFLNYWKKGTVRDNSRRIHPCLARFGELSPETQKKDFNNVEILLTLNEK